MKKLIIDPLEYQMREFFYTDFNGRIIKNENASEIFLKYPLRINLDRKYAQVLVSARVSKDIIHDSNNYLMFAYLLSEKALLEYLHNLKTFELFSKIELYIFKDEYQINKERLNDKFLRKDKFELELNQEQFQNIEKSLNEYLEIENITKFIIDELKDFAYNSTSFGYSYDKSKMMNYLSQLEYIFDQSFNFLQNPKSSLFDIRRNINDLAKRKRENNFNYQYQKTSLQNSTFSLHPPDIWLRKPVFSDEIIEQYKLKYA